MLVGAYHHVDAGLVEHGDEFGGDLHVAVPGFALVGYRRDMAYHDMILCVFVLGPLYGLRQPFGLLVTIGVIGIHARIFQIVVGLVLAGIEGDEAHRPLTPHEIEMLLTGTHVVVKEGGGGSACLMIAAHIVERLLRGEEADAFVHESREEFLGVGQDADHVAVADDHIAVLVSRTLQERLDGVDVLVNVVEDDERGLRFGRVERGEFQRLARIYIRCRHIAPHDMPSLALQHLGGEYAIAVGCVGREARKPHGVYLAHALYTHVRVIVFRTGTCVEIGAVIRRELYMSVTVCIGHPDDGSLGAAHILQVGAVNYLHGEARDGEQKAGDDAEQY